MFFDDILIYSKAAEEHVQHLQLVLEKLDHNSLYVNFKMCKIGKTTVSYLGHVISSARVAVDGNKVQYVVQWQKPRNLRELRGFLGLTGYYRRFVANYAQVAQPLTDQLKKDNFEWSEAATQAFMALKEAMVSPPVLAMPDFQKSFMVEVDASGYGLGAVLM